MNEFIILGTDTDAGKTTFALLWLQRFAERYEYWKPVETGDSDSARVIELIPSVVVHSSLLRLQAPVAPPLAAKLEGKTIPAACDLAAAVPKPIHSGRSLVIESFGGPFSPLNETELQIAFVRELCKPCVLVSSSKLGGIGRTLQSVVALRSEGVDPFAIVLVGPHDPFAQEQIERHLPGRIVVMLEPLEEWTPARLQKCAERQSAELDRLHSAFVSVANSLRELPPLAERVAHPPHMLAEDRRCVWHPYTSLLEADEPLACVGAHEEFLQLADGREVIDGISSWWTILHGHRHPPLMQALADASRKMDHVLFAGVTHPYAVELADLLLGTMPWFGGRVFYSDNGSTAVEVALKMAYQFWCHHGQPQRTRFVGFEHGYHGDTFGAMAVSRDPVFFGRFEPLLFKADILPLAADRLETHLQQYGQEIAGVILEPLVQGAGGMLMHSPETLKQIVEITHRHGMLFIADEVMTCGRTGTLWAHQVAGVAPDLVCAAKTLTGGVMPLAATLASPAIVSAFRSADRARTFFHGHSFTAHPLACAVAACNYRDLLSQPLAAPRRHESFWTAALEPLRHHPKVKEIRIRGSIAAVEIRVPGGYLADAGKTMRHKCLELGVFLRPLGSVLYALPPYCTSDASLRRIAEAMIAAVQSL